MYVYIFEHGEIEKHPDPPSEVDLMLINDGILSVLKCESVQDVRGRGDLVDLMECRWDEDADGRWHTPHYPLDEDDEG